MSVDRLRPFYENEKDTNCQTDHVADTTDNRDMTIGEKTNKKPEADVLGGRSMPIKTVCQPNRLGFGFVN